MSATSAPNANLASRSGTRLGRLASGASNKPMVDINMTPLIDVMLVLLVVFMVTAPLLTTSVSIHLPKTAQASTQSAEPKAATRLKVAVDAQDHIFLNDQAITLDALKQAFRKASAADPSSEVFLSMDQNLPYAKVIEIMGEAQAAHLTHIGFVAQPLVQPSP